MTDAVKVALIYRRSLLSIKLNGLAVDTVIDCPLTEKGPRSGTVGMLSCTVSDFGKNRLTIRMIRVK